METFKDFCAARGYNAADLTPPLRAALEKMFAEQTYLAAANAPPPSITPGE